MLKLRFLAASALCGTLCACAGGTPVLPGSPNVQVMHSQDWRAHYRQGLRLLDAAPRSRASTPLARAAFASAARIARDHAGAYAGVGLSEMMLGQLEPAQAGFVSAALLEDKALYWGAAALAALQNGDERLAYALYQRMQQSADAGDDEISHFLQAVYESDGQQGYPQPMQPITPRRNKTDIPDDLVCAKETDHDLCDGLSMGVEVFFVRATSTSSETAGVDLLNDLDLQISASQARSYENDDGTHNFNLLSQASFSVPTITYALQASPLENQSQVYLDAAPFVSVALGESSEIREGSNKTILYNAAGDAEQYTAETGITLKIKAQTMTPRTAQLAVTFSYSAVSALQPIVQAQVLDVTEEEFKATGLYEYGRPVILGRLTSGNRTETARGQKGLYTIPGLGGLFGTSDQGNTTNETLVLAKLSAPAPFSGQHEAEMLRALIAEGVIPQSADNPPIQRRNILHHAPDMVKTLRASLNAALQGAAKQAE